MTIDQINTGSFSLIDSDLPNGIAFADDNTGEILDFPESWRSNPERIEHILWCNMTGDYEEQGVLFGNCEEM